MSASLGSTAAAAAIAPDQAVVGLALLRRKLAAFVALTKPRIIELLLVTTVPTMVVAARGLPSATLVLATLVGGTLAAGGANAMNMVYDRDIDAVMGRTKGRPLVTGAVGPVAASVFAVGLEIAAFVELWLTVNLLSAVLAVAATVFYVGIYTMLLKRSTSQNIVIGGAAGAVPVLVGWSAVTGHLGLAPVIMFAIIFMWTPPHFWALAVRYRDDYAAAHVPMLPAVTGLRNVANQIIVYTAVLWALSLALGPLAHLGVVYLASAAVLGAAFVGKAWALRSDPSRKRAMSLFHYSISYLTLLFVAMGVDVLVGHLL
ncbi:MAG: heme o synthase [Acidimicrobiales bacterium]